MVAKLDRLSRSLVDFAGLLVDAQKCGYNVVALDLGVDLSTPSGEFLANVMASAAQWEQRMIHHPLNGFQPQLPGAAPTPIRTVKSPSPLVR